MANRPDEFPVFSPLEPSRMQRMVDIIHKFLYNVRDVLSIKDSSPIFCDPRTIYEIITRVEKRRVYFHIYYGGDLGELNEGALICFWIMKLMPFKHAAISNATLNSKIALTFFFNILFYVAAKNGKKVNTNGHLVSNLYYSFKYRDLSKEAIMALAESLLF